MTSPFGIILPFQRSTILLALCMGGFAIGIAEFSMMGVLPNFITSLNISELEASYIISTYALGVVIGGPIIIVLGARLKKRTLLLCLMTIFCLGNLGCALTPNYTFLLILRFISGIPHSGFFGLASLIAASMVSLNQRAWAVGRVLMGLPIATISGAPAAAWIGLSFGWRWSFVCVLAAASICAVLLWLFIPDSTKQVPSTARQELEALGKKQVWFAVLTGSIGFGGLFAIYTYVGPILFNVTLASKNYEAVILVMFGTGLILGNYISSQFADRFLRQTIIAALVWSCFSCLLFASSIHNLTLMTFAALAVGCNAALTPALQIRLMDVAGRSQSLAASLNHSAFNIANALGPWLAGTALNAGWGWRSPAVVGSILALTGLAVFCFGTYVCTNRKEHVSGM